MKYRQTLCPYGILCHICKHPVGLCEKVSSFRIKAITTARKAHWLSVALKVIAVVVLPNMGKSFFLCENHFSAQWLSADHQKVIACSKRSASETSEIDMIR